MHRAGLTILKTPHLIHPPSKDIPNNFVPFDVVTIIPELCGDLMGQGMQGTGCLHSKAPVTSAASAEGKQTLCFIGGLYIFLHGILNTILYYICYIDC